MYYIRISREDPPLGLPPAKAQGVIELILSTKPGNHGVLCLRGHDDLGETYQFVVTLRADFDFIVHGLQRKNIRYAVESDPVPDLDDEDDERDGTMFAAEDYPDHGVVFVLVDGQSYSREEAREAYGIIATIFAEQNGGVAVVRAGIRSVPGGSSYWVGFNTSGAAYAFMFVLHQNRIPYKTAQSLPDSDPARRNPPLKLVGVNAPPPSSRMLPQEPAQEGRRGWRGLRPAVDPPVRPDPPGTAALRGVVDKLTAAGRFLPDSERASKGNPFAPRARPSAPAAPRRWGRGRKPDQQD